MSTTGVGSLGTADTDSLGVAVHFLPVSWYVMDENLSECVGAG